jgi:Fis family transcriptional regulator
MSPPAKKDVTSRIASCVESALAEYFSDLDGHHPNHDLYDMVIKEVEYPLLKAIMRFTAGNQSRAAEILGINRSTLRKKLEKFGLNK